MKNRPGVATVSQALAVFLAAFASIIGIGVVIHRTGLPVEAAVLAAPAATLLVAVGAIRVFRLRPYRALQLRPAKNAHLLLSVPVALALFVLSDQLASLSRQFIPIDEETMRAIAEMVRADGWISWIVLLGGVGFGAAVSEELLFRGVILTGLRRLGRGGAIVVSALLFTAMHGLLLPNYFVAGVVLAVTAATTRSILVPISIHFFHNLTALLLFNLAGVETLGDPVWIPAGILAPSIAILGIGLFVYIRGDESSEARRKRRAAEAAAGASEEAWLPIPPPGTLALGKDLKGVPPGRRRLGFFVLFGALVFGLSIAAGVFVLLGYVSNPALHRAAVIETMRRVSVDALAETAGPRGDELDAAFESLTELNREGRVGLRELWRTARVVGQATADGDFGEGDVDLLLMTVGSIRSEAPPRSAPRATGPDD